MRTQHSTTRTPQNNYLPLLDGLRMFGISRARGYELVRAQLLDTFTIGTRRYVYIESLQTLPQRVTGWSRKKQAAIEAANASEAASNVARVSLP